MRELKSQIEQTVILAPATVSATFVSDAIALGDCNSLNVAAYYSAIGGTLGLEESDDNITWTSVSDDLEVVGQTLTAGAYDALSGVVVDAAYVGNAAYVRLSGTVDASDTVLAYAIKGELANG